MAELVTLKENPYTYLGVVLGALPLLPLARQLLRNVRLCSAPTLHTLHAVPRVLRQRQPNLKVALGALALLPFMCQLLREARLFAAVAADAAECSHSGRLCRGWADGRRAGCQCVVRALERRALAVQPSQQVHQPLIFLAQFAHLFHRLFGAFLCSAIQLID